MATLTPGEQFGSYEVLSLIGIGGMGEVYRAKDSRLKRDVAIKVLPDEVSRDPERLARFQREAEVLASLNHPNIAAIHGLEDSDGIRALVLEFVEGETLAERLRRGALPIDEALSVGRQICDALEAAHEKGIIHRDLKPANIKITPEGKVKVLDFGLAKMSEPPAAMTGLSESPTVVSGTRDGVILGTPAYMSPEQARGKQADKRIDIWAFGCVLYEMLTARQAFTGETLTDVMAAILTREADWRPLANVPEKLRELLTRCLLKDPTRRLRDIGEARITLDDVIAPQVQASGNETAAKPKRLSLAIWILVIPASFALGAGLMWFGGMRSSPAPTWSGARLGGPEIALMPRVSPNGSLVAFHAMVNGQAQVAVMQPESGDWTVLTHDRTRGYISNSVSWSPDGTRIYYGRVDGVPRGVFSVAAVGGEERLVLEDASCPEVLPDGSLLVIRLNEKRQFQIYRFWPETGRLQAYPGITPGFEGEQPRAFRDGKEAVFWGRSTEQPDSDPNIYLYALDLASASIRRIPTDMLSAGPSPDGSGLALSVGADDRTILSWVPRGDFFVVLQIPRAGGATRELTSLTNRVWGFDVAANGDLYMDQVSRPVEILLMDSDGGHPQTQFTSDTYFDTAGAPMPDGRVLFTIEAGGRKRLLAAKAGANPTRLLQTAEETSGPVTMIGSSEVAFLIGSGATRKLAIASLADGRIVRRLEKADGHSIQSLAASPDGQMLYYAASGKIWAIPSSDGPPKFIRDGDSVAADPHGQYLVIQLNEKDNVRLVRVPIAGGPDQPLAFPGIRLATTAIPSNAIRSDGAIIKNFNSSDYYPWSPVVLIPETGKVQRIPMPSFLDIHYAGWTANGKIVVFGQETNSSIWRLHPSFTRK